MRIRPSRTTRRSNCGSTTGLPLSSPEPKIQFALPSSPRHRFALNCATLSDVIRNGSSDPRSGPISVEYGSFSSTSFVCTNSLGAPGGRSDGGPILNASELSRSPPNRLSRKSSPKETSRRTCFSISRSIGPRRNGQPIHSQTAIATTSTATNPPSTATVLRPSIRRRLPPGPSAATRFAMPLPRCASPAPAPAPGVATRPPSKQRARARPAARSLRDLPPASGEAGDRSWFNDAGRIGPPRNGEAI